MKLQLPDRMVDVQSGSDTNFCTLSDIVSEEHDDFERVCTFWQQSSDDGIGRVPELSITARCDIQLLSVIDAFAYDIGLKEWLPVMFLVQLVKIAAA